MNGAPEAEEHSAKYYASLESMEGYVTEPTSGSPKTGNVRTFEVLRMVYPGVLAAGTIALAATWLSQAYNAPVMLFALLLGIAFHFLYDEGVCRPGIEFAARKVLRLGVTLLGLRLAFGQVADLGIQPVLTVTAGVITTVILGLFVGRMLGLGHFFGLLSGGAVAICGASAALAISTTLPAYPNKERDTVLTVVGVTALSTIAMVVYPLIVTSLHLDNSSAGVFIGGTIHDVAQVVGAGYMISPQTGDISTYVKLLRVAMLIPVILTISIVFRATRLESARNSAIFPLFLIGFAVLVILNSLVALPATLTQAAISSSNWCLVTAIAALGMKTSLRDLFSVGWKPLVLMVAETVWIALLVLTSLHI